MSVSDFLVCVLVKLICIKSAYLEKSYQPLWIFLICWDVLRFFEAYCLCVQPLLFCARRSTSFVYKYHLLK